MLREFFERVYARTFSLGLAMYLCTCERQRILFNDGNFTYFSTIKFSFNR